MYGNKNAEGASIKGGMMDQLDGSITNNDDFKSHQHDGKTVASGQDPAQMALPAALDHGDSSQNLMLVQSEAEAAANLQKD